MKQKSVLLKRNVHDNKIWFYMNVIEVFIYFSLKKIANLDVNKKVKFNMMQLFDKFGNFLVKDIHRAIVMRNNFLKFLYRNSFSFMQK